MDLVYKGKTKDVYKLQNGNYMLKFKDDVTGTDGVFDPGANTVGLQIAGIGKAGLLMSKYFFEKMNAAGIKTHFVEADGENVTMTVLPCARYGNGLEVVCRRKADGSFVRRYGSYCEKGQDLDYFVEITLKDDDREDPPITKDALVTLGIMSDAEYEDIKAQTKKLTKFINDEMEAKGMELFDIKFEFGKSADGVLLIDEISGGNMRVYKGTEIMKPMDLANTFIK